jgi:hypothetical protein
MFSKELQLMDRNTAKYMIDELQEQLDTANSTIREKEAALSEKRLPFLKKRLPFPKKTPLSQGFKLN